MNATEDERRNAEAAFIDKVRARMDEVE